jgi:hypothetical protein
MWLSSRHRLGFVDDDQPRFDTRLPKGVNVVEDFIGKFFNFSPKFVEPCAERDALCVAAKERLFAHDRYQSAASPKLGARLADVISILPVLEGRIHHDAVVLATVLQKIAVADDVAVTFGGEYALQREVIANGRKIIVRMCEADRVEDFPFAATGLQHPVRRIYGRVGIMNDTDGPDDDGAKETLWRLKEFGTSAYLVWSRKRFGGRFADRQPESLSDAAWAELLAQLGEHKSQE